MWATSYQHHIKQHLTIANGWELLEDNYKPLWCEGDQVAKSLIPDEDELERAESEMENYMNIASSDEEESSDEESSDEEMMAIPADLLPYLI